MAAMAESQLSGKSNQQNHGECYSDEIDQLFDAVNGERSEAEANPEHQHALLHITNDALESELINRPTSSDSKKSTKKLFFELIDYLSMIIVFGTRLFLASIANLFVIFSILIANSIGIFIVGGLFYFVYYVIAGNNKNMNSFNESVKYLTEISINSFGRIISVIGDYIQSLSSSPICQILLISILLILSLNHAIKEGYKGLRSITKRKWEVIINITKWAFEPLNQRGIYILDEEE